MHEIIKRYFKTSLPPKAENPMHQRKKTIGSSAIISN
jgi:hypothetical protein